MINKAQCSGAVDLTELWLSTSERLVCWQTTIKVTLILSLFDKYHCLTKCNGQVVTTSGLQQIMYHAFCFLKNQHECRPLRFELGTPPELQLAVLLAQPK